MDQTRLVSSLVEQQKDLNFTMLIDGSEHPVESFSAEYLQTPMTRPAMRGGVYFSNLKELKIKAKLLGTALSHNLSKAMLGPSTDFGTIKFLTQIEIDGAKKHLAISAHLTNYIQRGGGLELSLVVIGFDLSD